MTSQMLETERAAPTQGLSRRGKHAVSAFESLRAPETGLKGLLLAFAGLLLTSVIGIFDYWIGPDLSFPLLYLIPIALGAWCGGFSHGVLLALVATVSWHLVDVLDRHVAHHAVLLWNTVVRFGIFVLTASLLSRLRTSIQHERQLARTDPLTGAANARTFYATLCVESERACRTAQPLTLAYIDLDDFKKLNDKLGHSAGDKALSFLTQTIQSNLRAADVFARLGGDEFALLLPSTDAAGAVQLLTRLQTLLNREMSRQGWAVTTSIGAATFLRPADDVDVMIRHVDGLMYTVKKSGKGKIAHESIADAAEARSETPRRPELRADQRVLCRRLARVNGTGAGATDADELATVRDISRGGVGLHLERQIPEQTILVIEPLHGHGGKTLLARVVRSSPESTGWFYGCILSTFLSDEELQSWLGSSGR